VRSKKVLIIGAGRIAGLNETDPAREKPCTHVGAYQANEHYKVGGVLDSQIDAAQHFADTFQIPHAFDDVKTALAEIKPDHVSIAIPYQFHHDAVTACAESVNRPSTIFCEKPIANTLERAEAMNRICSENQISLFVNNRRLASVYRLAKQIIEEEFESDIITINASCSSGLHAIGLHMLDLMRFFCGDVSWVTADEETQYVEKLAYSANFVPSDPRVRGLIGFKNGITGTFSNTALTEYTYFEVEILCAKGKIRVSDNGGMLQVWKSKKPGTSTLSYKLTEPEIRVPTPSPLFQKIAIALANDEHLSNPDHPLSARNGVESYRLLSILIDSAKSGKKQFCKKSVS